MIPDLASLASASFDLWTFVHLGFGILFGFIFIKQQKGYGKAIILWLGFFLAWEFFELAQPSGNFGGAETGGNLLVDLATGLTGLALGAWISRNDKVPK